MTDDSIHADGTVETLVRWRPGGAQEQRPKLFDGEQYLVAVRVTSIWPAFGGQPERRSESWEFAVVTARCDSDEPLDLEVGGEPSGWTWDDVEWFVPVRTAIDLPVPQKTER